MSTSDLQQKPPEKLPAGRHHGSIIKSFWYAWQGIAHTSRSQRNFRIQLAAGAAAGIAAACMNFSGVEWAILVLIIATVLILEMLNTVTEAIVDLLSPEYHPLAKIAKDVAAGAVLIASLTAVAIGALLFLSH